MEKHKIVTISIPPSIWSEFGAKHKNRSGKILEMILNDLGYSDQLDELEKVKKEYITKLDTLEKIIANKKEEEAKRNGKIQEYSERLNKAMIVIQRREDSEQDMTESFIDQVATNWKIKKSDIKLKLHEYREEMGYNEHQEIEETEYDY